VTGTRPGVGSCDFSTRREVLRKLTAELSWSWPRGTQVTGTWKPRSGRLGGLMAVEGVGEGTLGCVSDHRESLCALVVSLLVTRPGRVAGHRVLTAISGHTLRPPRPHHGGRACHTDILKPRRRQ
jgi:hypothetical protein